MIEVDHLKKQFGPLVAVDDISFKVAPGEILGFLGPNGAGKSTTMKVVTGFLAPSAGRVTVWGCDIETDTLEAQKHIGYLPEGAPCYDEMTVITFLEFIAEIRGYRGDEAIARVKHVVETMALEEVLGQRIETLSKGFKRRVGQVLILDEPTDVLDPNQKHHVREMIRGLSKDKIVIISTHILEEVTAVCTRAMIISHGRILSDCKPAELESQSRYHGAITIRVQSVEQAEALQDTLAQLPGVRSVERSADELELTAFKVSQDTDLFGPITELAGDASLGIVGIYQEKGRLDEVFRHITEGEAA